MPILTYELGCILLSPLLVETTGPQKPLNCFHGDCSRFQHFHRLNQWIPMFNLITSHLTHGFSGTAMSLAFLWYHRSYSALISQGTRTKEAPYEILECRREPNPLFGYPSQVRFPPGSTTFSTWRSITISVQSCHCLHPPRPQFFLPKS